MSFDAKVRVLWAILAIFGALLGIGASYRSGGLSGLRELTLDTLQSLGVHHQTTSSSNLPSHDYAVTAPSVTLSADEIFWLTIKNSKVSELFEEFLAKYPTSPHVAEARAKLQQLKNVPAPQQPFEQQPTMPMQARPRTPMMMQQNSN
jgi:hypothetical protein